MSVELLSILVTSNIIGEASRLGFGSAIAVVLFAISVGPLPAAGDYALPAEQTYDDGEVVMWADGPDDELPAPVLTVVDAAGQGADDAEAGDGGSDGANGTDGSLDGNGTDDPLARGLAVGALAVGAVGLGIGAVSLRRSRV